MLTIIFYLLLITSLSNLIFCWCKKCHELGFEKINKIGRLEARVGIEKPGHRDFDLTISGHPTYTTFQLSLWTVYCGFEWSKDPKSHPDCNHDGVECFYCGCKNRCGEKNKENNG